MPAANLQLESIPVVETGMRIRAPVNEVFEALADPAITTSFWFTKSSGRLAPGATVQWIWEMYDVSTAVSVKEFAQDSRIVFDWGPPGGPTTTVELRLDPREDGTTFVSLTESGFSGDGGDEVVAWALGSMGGWTQVIAALKAFLEHKIVLAVVADRFPDGRPG